MVRGILIFAAAVAIAGLAGCTSSPEEAGGMYGYREFSAPPGMVERGADDVYRLDLRMGRPAFARLPEESDDSWLASEVDYVSKELPKLKKKAGDFVLGLDEEGEVRPVATKAEMSFERKPAIEAIEEFVAKCRGVGFFDTRSADRSELEGVVLTAKAGAVDEEMLFPYLRAVFQMNGFDLVPIEVPFHGRGFMVVKLERLASPLIEPDL